MDSLIKIIGRSLISTSIKHAMGVQVPRNAEEFASFVASKAMAKKLVADYLNKDSSATSISEKE